MPCSCDRKGMWDRRENVIIALVMKWLDSDESAKSTALGALATGTGETAIVGGLNYSSNMGWNKRSQSSLFGGLQGAGPEVLSGDVIVHIHHI
ncbi:hypothetical protein Tco_0708621 [Tanacetum coccineum]